MEKKKKKKENKKEEEEEEYKYVLEELFDGHVGLQQISTL